MGSPSGSGWRTARRLSQVGVFLAFVFLFLNTEYKDNDVLEYAVNILLRLDPLVAGAAVLAGRALISLVWPALITVALTLLLGRFFCGWACPLGAILDFADATVLRRWKRRRAVPPGLRRTKYLLLAFLFASSVFTLQFVFLFDPISVLIRSFAVSVYPAVNLTLETAFAKLYDTPVAPVSEPVYGLLRDHFLSFEQPYFQMSALVGVLFLGILALELLQRRFWCRNLCPLGALLGLLGRVAPLKRWVSQADCISCDACRKTCRTGAVADDYLGTAAGECIECVDCVAVCPTRAVHFGGSARARPEPVGISRREVVASLALGAVAVPFFKVEAREKAPHPLLIRPPGALPEPEFLARCTRCGECMRVCIANGLQPAYLQAGFAGLWSPILVARVGYCEYNCTLCGQVCPTGAIRRLSQEEKHKTKLGLAEVDRSACLPWKGTSECIVCEEHCPTPQKAIKLRWEDAADEDGNVRPLKRPYVDDELCVGCGICETKCPLADKSAILVTRRGESRAKGDAKWG